MLTAEQQADRAERVTGDAALRDQVEELNRVLAAFEEASGIAVRDLTRLGSARQTGELVKLVREWQHSPEWAAKELLRNSDSLRGHSEGLARIAAALLPDQSPESTPAIVR